MGGYYDLPPVADPLSPNKVFFRYAEDYFNRPGNAVIGYNCKGWASFQVTGRDPNCTLDGLWGGPERGRTPESPWVWTSPGYYHSTKINNLDSSYQDNRGGYNVSVSYNCIGAYGRYL